MKIEIVLGILLLASTSLMASGGFGEVAGTLVFNSTVNTRTWTLVNNYNKSLNFYVVKPNFTSIPSNNIYVSSMNGTITPNSQYNINITISLAFPSNYGNATGYITAFVTANSVNGSTIRLATIKKMKVVGFKSVDIISPPIAQSTEHNINNSDLTWPFIIFSYVFMSGIATLTAKKIIK